MTCSIDLSRPSSAARSIPSAWSNSARFIAELLHLRGAVRALSRAGACDLRSPEAYVKRAITNEDLDRRRARSTWRRFLPRLVTASEQRDEVVDVVRAEDVRQALFALSPRQRACVVLWFYEDLTVPEVARALGCSEGGCAWARTAGGGDGAASGSQDHGQNRPGEGLAVALEAGRDRAARQQKVVHTGCGRRSLRLVWRLAVFGEMTRTSAISLLLRPRASSRREPEGDTAGGTS